MSHLGQYPDALINITRNIRKPLADRNISFGIFVDLQKAFDTTDHQILLAKLDSCSFK